jgi:hypothetical protein
MSLIINYQDVNVKINNSLVYATSASVSFEAQINTIRALGARNAFDDVFSGPVQGTLNIDYIVTNSNDPGKTIFENIINGNYTPTLIEIGGRNFNGYLTNHSLNAEPNSVIDGSLEFNVYDQLTNNGLISSSENTSSTVNLVGHGAGSNIGINDVINFDYVASVEWETFYKLSASTPVGVKYQNASQRLTLNGPNLGRQVTQCKNTNLTTISIKSICGNSLFDITIPDPLVESSESNIQAGGFVEGSFVLIKNY